MEVKALKCVGGSKDGVTVMVGDSTSYFFTAVRPGILLRSIRELDVQTAATFDEQCYTRRVLYSIELFALESMPDHDVIARLVDRYRP